MKNYNERINELLFEEGSRQEKQILKYLKQNIDQLPNLKLNTIASQNYCSPTSVTRVIQKLGFTGFKELQVTIKVDLHSNQRLIATKNNYQLFIDNFIDNSCTYIYGKGASQIAAQHLFRKLLRKNIDVSLVTEVDLLYILKRKTIIIISNSGETHSVINLVTDLKKYNQCTVLSITRENSQLAMLSDYSLLNPKNPNDQRECQIQTIQLIDKLINYFH